MNGVDIRYRCESMSISETLAISQCADYFAEVAPMFIYVLLCGLMYFL